MLLLLTTAPLLPTIAQTQGSSLQSNSNAVIDFPLIFHYYSLIERADDNSSYVYEGVDGYGPKLSSSFVTSLNCQIYGKMQGWDHWSASVMWVLKLQKDVHIKGNVEMKVFISSTFSGFGFFDGGGYGMGLLDLDENRNEVAAFPTEGAGGLGNPFSKTPQPYVLNLEVDYIFEKDHYIGFFVGAGATIKGYTFDVHFDSPDAPSGVNLPIEDQAEAFRFSAVGEGNSYEITAVSTSYLSNFKFNQPDKQISFKASGIPGTVGNCKVTMPKALLEGPFKITIDGQQKTSTETENDTHSFIQFAYTNDVDIIKIFAESTKPPQLDRITLLPASTKIQIGSTQEFSAQGYDQDNNPLLGLVYDWSVTGDIGTVDSHSGQSVTFVAQRVGNGSLTAMTTYAGITKTVSASVTVMTTSPLNDTPPVIAHIPITDANIGQAIAISAEITDDVAVVGARIHCRKGDELAYTVVEMTSSGNIYEGNIPASMVTISGVQYYISATDGISSSMQPAAQPETSPHFIVVTSVDVTPKVSLLKSPLEITQDSMKIEWTQNTEADFARYEIYQSTISGTLGSKICSIAERSVTYHVATGLSEDTTYYFSIRVIDASENFSDSDQVYGKTTKSTVAEFTLPWIWWVIGGVIALSAPLVVMKLLLRFRKNK